MNSTLPKKDPKLDLIRCTACFFVVCVHFFLNTDYYDIPVASFRMYILTCMRSFFLISVPLFLMLSGYLMNRKVLSLRYYRSIVKTLGIYLLASISCFIYKKIFLTPDIALHTLIRETMHYIAAPYAWYIEMYIGLFLMIPFLNLIYHSLHTQKEKQWLIITFIILSTLPATFNCLPLTTKGWFHPPVPNTNILKVFPAYWTTIYPITYYFWGCYFSEYKLRGNRFLHLLLIFLNTAALAGFCFFMSYPNRFVWGIWSDYGALLPMVISVLFFGFMLNLPISFGKRSARILRTVSNCCLGAYLVSYIFDNLFYRWLAEYTHGNPLQFRYFLPMVIAVFSCSITLSFVLNQIYNICEKILSALFAKFHPTHENPKEEQYELPQ